jgi:pimeloyl-ACP methyl ester carboxylesterase
MSWSRFDPGAGDPGAIWAMATARSDESSEVLHELPPLVRKAEGIGSAWTGDGALRYRDRIGEIDTRTLKLGSFYDRHADALFAYAAAVEELAQDARELHARVAANEEELRLLRLRLDALASDPAAAADLPALESKVTAAQSQGRGFESEWDALTTRRLGADRACIEALDDAADGSGPRSGYTADGLYTDTEIMSVLAGLTAAQVAALLASDPSFADRLGAVQDAGAVASWWQTLAPPVAEGEVPLPSAGQLALLMAAPSLFGNLNGIWYGHRDLANRETFRVAMESATAIATTYYAKMGEGVAEAEAFLAQHGYTIEAFTAEYGELQAIQATLEREDTFSEGAPPYQFIVYVPGHPTLAALSVGDMDTATQVTTNVPGMGSTVTNTLEEWTMTAQNLYYEQFDMDEHFNTDETAFASVAWIGYEAPVMPWVNPFDVLSSADAHAGAPNLVDFLEGVSGTRGWEPGENLSVVAHSYGTTVASLALAETPVESFVMLGSAGIDSSIPDVSYLQVDPENVWASEAAGDHVADVGRWGEHPVNPTGADYHANVFSTEDGYLVGDLLAGSDVHDSAPRVVDVIDGVVPSENDPYGYLDLNTTGLRSTALITLGVTDPLVHFAGGGGGGGGGGGR